jgi:hypothetical protein
MSTVRQATIRVYSVVSMQSPIDPENRLLNERRATKKISQNLRAKQKKNCDRQATTTENIFLHK